MQCAWKELLGILPPGIRNQVDKIGKDSLQELRLRINAPPELVLPNAIHWLPGRIVQEDLDFIINTATRYSPWTAASAAQGYITGPGGHRIGLCGEMISKESTITGMRRVRSLCIRIARDFPGIGNAAAALNTSMLILGAPGTGKTTLLRDLVRQLAKSNHVAVVDERCELFPEGFAQGMLQDTLTGCGKAQGMEMVLRTMGPDYIAVDEITAEADCLGLLNAANCGVKLLATAHAGSLEDFRRRRIYSVLWEEKVFHTALVLKRDKTFTLERMEQWA